MMLPGVECARRRRLHQSGGWSDSPGTSGHGWTRRPSFCLYTSNHDNQSLSSSSSHMQRSSTTYHGGYEDEKLGGLAREAKERLDERLGSQRKSLANKGNSAKDIQRYTEMRTRVSRNLARELFRLKKSGGSKSNPSNNKLEWKATEQDECAICLDQFMAGEGLASLPCAHRFHSSCLVPWLKGNAHCPCCRMGIKN